MFYCALVAVPLSRKDFLAASGAALAALALPRFARAGFGAARALGVASYVSAPSLKPPTSL